MSTYGSLRCLARDFHGEKLWLCAERHAFELKVEREESDFGEKWIKLMMFFGGVFVFSRMVCFKQTCVFVCFLCFE